jgi:hypothetical protein
VKETSNGDPNTTSRASMLETNVGDWASNENIRPKKKATTAHRQKGVRSVKGRLPIIGWKTA